MSNEPPGLTESLGRFRDDHPDPRRAGFLMMRYSGTRLHDEITQAVRACLKKFGISALRADDKQYHEDLYPTIATYMHGCGFGIAVFDRLETEVFNPNISLEVGYMLGLRKKVCILKDKTLTHLHTDLIGKLFRQFDPQNPLQSIPEVLGAWLRENGLLE